jgi:serine/threonine protein kinase
VKLIDFEYATFKGELESSEIRCGTDGFVSGEMDNYSAVSFASDVWSAGAVLQYLFCKVNNLEKPDDTFYLHVQSRATKLPECKLTKLLRRMLVSLENSRITAREALAFLSNPERQSTQPTKKAGNRQILVDQENYSQFSNLVQQISN